MKLALVSDQPYLSRPAKQYIAGVVAAVAAHTGTEIDVVMVPAVEEDQPGMKAPALALLRESREGLLERLTLEHPDAVVSMGSAALKALAEGNAPVTLKKEHGRMRWLALGDSISDGVPWTPTLDAWRVARSNGADLHRDFIGVILKAVTQWAPLPDVPITLLVATSAADLRDSL
ncbi:MAG TPA: hypothetical protein VGO79_12200, partial [Thermoanaerobaculia bacterium]